MRTNRARFKYALRFTRNIEDTARADSLAWTCLTVPSMVSGIMCEN